MRFRYAAVIPCYNVNGACVPVFQKTVTQVKELIGIDDGSTDSTLYSMQSLKLPNLTLLRHEKNYGKGKTLVTGFRHVLSKLPDIDAVITLDGDGQHDPSLIPLFIEEFEKTEPDLIYGNRFANRQGMPLHRAMLNGLSNRILSRICHQPIYDSQCGFRLYSRKLIQDQIDQWNTVHYELETEILIKVCRKGRKIASVPVTMIYSNEATKLSHHSLMDVMRIAKVLIGSMGGEN